MFHFMRHGFIIILLITFASADTYQETLLNIHAKIFPKMVLSDVDIEQKQVDDGIKVIILHREEDTRSASYLKKKILEAYPLLETYPLDVALLTYDAFDELAHASAYYLLFATDKEMEKVVQVAQKKSTLTFAYDSTSLDHGICMALDVGKKVMPYISLESLKQSNITLKNFIYQVAKLR